jgi:hypothetical protein
VIDLGDVIAHVIFAREAVELDERAIAESVLRDLEADLLFALNPQPTIRCDRCAMTFTWAGELDHHRRFAHAIESDGAS